MPRFPSNVGVGLILSSVVAAACNTAQDRIVLLAGDRLQRSGFLEFVIASYRDVESDVAITATGDTFADRLQTAHVLLSHDPEREQQLMDAGDIEFYRKFMFNKYVLAGPADDPANVREATSVADALRRIAAANVPFVSRGDGSATDEHEQRLWRLAGVDPSQRVETGQDMIATLREASKRGAYCLALPTDLSRLRPEVALEPLFDRDDHLLNTYAVLVRKGSPRAAREFAEWLAEGQGRVLVERYRSGDRAPFSLWPVTAPSKTPDAVPMQVP